MIPLIIPLIACAPADANHDGGQPSGPDTCGMAEFAGLIGQPRSALAGLDLPERTRIIGYRQPVTMDFLPQRLNIELDDDGIIDRMRCG